MPTSARQVFPAPTAGHTGPALQGVALSRPGGQSRPPLRNPIGKRCVGADAYIGPPHRTPCNLSLVWQSVLLLLGTGVLRIPTTSLRTGLGMTRKFFRLLSLAVAIRTPSPKTLFPSCKKGAPPPGRAPFQTDSIHQKSALPTVRGCSSTSRMLLTPVRYMTIRSKPRPKPACLQVP